jgi:hypothetical protein
VTPPTLPIYVQPEGDEPLDAIEQAVVRMWIAIIVRELREAGHLKPEELAEAAANDAASEGV